MCLSFEGVIDGEGLGHHFPMARRKAFPLFEKGAPLRAPTSARDSNYFGDLENSKDLDTGQKKKRGISNLLHHLVFADVCGATRRVRKAN